VCGQNVELLNVKLVVHNVRIELNVCNCVVTEMVSLAADVMS